MAFNFLLNNKKRLRNIWWVAIFFLVLASITFPIILLSQYYKFEITIFYQAVIVVVTSLICQLFRREKFSSLFGSFNFLWIKHLFLGCLIGAMLMFMPALFLYMLNAVDWQTNALDFSALFSVTMLFISVAIAEEVLFRGFIFQRLLEGIGQWPAQLIIAAYFLLIHLNNPGMTGSIKIIASFNIFLASIIFGLAFIKTRSLAMPLGIHFMANWVQGPLLGFGVSGSEQASMLMPLFNQAPHWLTGGSFGLEASIPGLISVIITILILLRWKPYIPGSNTVTIKTSFWQNR